jgi:hypothetical protein
VSAQPTAKTISLDEICAAIELTNAYIAAPVLRARMHGRCVIRAAGLSCDFAYFQANLALRADSFRSRVSPGPRTSGPAKTASFAAARISVARRFVPPIISTGGFTTTHEPQFHFGTDYPEYLAGTFDLRRTVPSI